MSRFLLALRCFFAVLFYYRLPRDAVALLPPPDLTPLPGPSDEPEPAVAAAKPAAAAEKQLPIAEKQLPVAEKQLPVAVQELPPAEKQLPVAEKQLPDDLRRRGAVQMLALLQREGRLIDFLMEEVEGYGDAQIGAAARDIHRGCRKGLIEHVKIAPVRPEPDEAAVRVEEGYDPSAVRLIGTISGRPPFHGTLRHHGWRAGSVLLPDLPPSHDPQVITPAEVELGG